MPAPASPVTLQIVTDQDFDQVIERTTVPGTVGFMTVVTMTARKDRFERRIGESLGEKAEFPKQHRR